MSLSTKNGIITRNITKSFWGEIVHTKVQHLFEVLLKMFKSSIKNVWNFLPSTNKYNNPNQWMLVTGWSHLCVEYLLCHCPMLFELRFGLFFSLLFSIKNEHNGPKSIEPPLTYPNKNILLAFLYRLEDSPKNLDFGHQ